MNFNVITLEHEVKSFECPKDAFEYMDLHPGVMYYFDAAVDLDC